MKVEQFISQEFVEVACYILQDPVPNCTEELIVDVPDSNFQEKTGEATMVIRQECVPERSVEQIVDVPTAFFSSVTSVTRRTS